MAQKRGLASCSTRSGADKESTAMTDRSDPPRDRDHVTRYRYTEFSVNTPFNYVCMTIVGINKLPVFLQVAVFCGRHQNMQWLCVQWVIRRKTRFETDSHRTETLVTFVIIKQHEIGERYHLNHAILVKLYHPLLNSTIMFTYLIGNRDLMIIVPYKYSYLVTYLPRSFLLIISMTVL